MEMLSDFFSANYRFLEAATAFVAVVVLISCIDDLFIDVRYWVREIWRKFKVWPHHKALTPEQVRWGFENLKLDEDRLHEIGMTGMVAPFSLSCRDHSGNGSAWMLEWDGSRFVKASDVLYSDQLEVAPLMESEARKYAAANAPWPMNDGCPP